MTNQPTFPIDGDGMIKIALCQINATVGDIDGNTEKIRSRIGEASSRNCDIVLFPELAVSGYPAEDLLLRESFVRDCMAALGGLADACEGLTAVIGTPWRDDGNTYNAAAVITDGDLVGIYYKWELPNYGVFDEHRYFSAGTRPGIFRCGNTKFGVTICEDLWIAGNAVEQLHTAENTPLILNLSASPFHAGKLGTRSSVVNRFAKNTGAVVCDCNLVGGQDELVFDGGSRVAGAGIEGTAVRFKEDLYLCGVNFGRETKIEAGQAEALEKIEEIRQAIVLGIRDYARKNRFDSVVIGLSGGIDSAVTLALAVEAVGADRVYAVTMPSHFTSTATLSDAEQIARNFGVALETIPIKSIFDSYITLLNAPLDINSPGIESENLQARVRGNILMAFSNRFGRLVLTTGNKSETAVGYSTLYGDSAGGFAPIKDVPKTLVYELAHHLNELMGTDAIPESVIARAPSAELRPNQKDEDSLPPYELLDRVLECYVERAMAAAEIAALLKSDEETVRDVIRLVNGSEYKRRQSPPGVKITPLAFGRDRRMPIAGFIPQKR